MMTPLTYLRWVWKQMPSSLRRPFFANSNLGRIRTNARDLLIRLANHDEVYDEEYYHFLDASSSRAARIMANTIVKVIGPKTALDIGCGTGALLAALQDIGVSVSGVGYSNQAVRYCRRRNLMVTQSDLGHDPLPRLARADVVTCFEVAEHLPDRRAEPLAAYLSSLAPCILFSAATPGQGGTHHVNEQPHEYWIEKFFANQFRLDEEISSTIRQTWRAEMIANEYSSNVMLFRSAR